MAALVSKVSLDWFKMISQRLSLHARASALNNAVVVNFPLMTTAESLLFFNC